MDVNLNAILSFAVRGLSGLASGAAMLRGVQSAATGAGNALRSNAFAAGFFMRASYSLAQAAGGLVAEFGKLDDIMARAKGLLGENNKEIQALARAIQLTRHTEFGPAQIGKTLLELQYAGLGGADAIKALNTTLDVATVTGWQEEAAAKAVANAHFAWNDAFTGTNEIMSRFVNAANSSTFKIHNLLNAMTLAQGASKTYGQSLNETLTAVAMFAPITGANTKAGTAWAAALRSLGEKKKQLEFKKMGIELEDATGKMRPALSIFADFVQKIQGQSGSKAALLTTHFFGERGSRAIAAVTQVMREGVKDANGQWVTGAKAIDVWRDKITKGTMTLDEMAKVSRKSLPMAWKMLTAQIQRTLIEFGAKAEPYIRWFMDRVKEMAGGLERIFKSWIGDVIVFIGKLATAAAMLKLIGYLATASGIAPMLAQAFPGAAGVLRAPSRIGGAVTGWGTQLALQAALMRGQAVRNAAGAIVPLASFSQRIPGQAFSVGGSVASAVARLNAGVAAGATAQAAGIGSRIGAAALSAGSLITRGAGAILGGLLSPVSLLITAFWGLSYIADKIREKEEARLAQEEKYRQIIGGSAAVGQGLYQTFASGKMAVSPGIAGTLFKNPVLAQAYGDMVVDINDMLAAKAAGDPRFANVSKQDIGIGRYKQWQDDMVKRLAVTKGLDTKTKQALMAEFQATSDQGLPFLKMLGEDAWKPVKEEVMKGDERKTPLEKDPILQSMLLDPVNNLDVMAKKIGEAAAAMQASAEELAKYKFPFTVILYKDGEELGRNQYEFGTGPGIFHIPASF